MKCDKLKQFQRKQTLSTFFFFLNQANKLSALHPHFHPYMFFFVGRQEQLKNRRFNKVYIYTKDYFI